MEESINKKINESIIIFLICFIFITCNINIMFGQLEEQISNVTKQNQELLDRLEHLQCK